MFENDNYEQRDYTYTTSLVRQMQNKRIGSSSMNYSNKAQTRLQNAYKLNYYKSKNNNKKNNLDNINEIDEYNKDNNKNIYRTDIKLNRSNTDNNKNKKCSIV